MVASSKAALCVELALFTPSIHIIFSSDFSITNCCNICCGFWNRQSPVYLERLTTNLWALGVDLDCQWFLIDTLSDFSSFFSVCLHVLWCVCVYVAQGETGEAEGPGRAVLQSSWSFPNALCLDGHPPFQHRQQCRGAGALGLGLRHRLLSTLLLPALINLHSTSAHLYHTCSYFVYFIKYTHHKFTQHTLIDSQLMREVCPVF